MLWLCGIFANIGSISFIQYMFLVRNQTYNVLTDATPFLISQHWSPAFLKGPERQPHTIRFSVCNDK